MKHLLMLVAIVFSSVRSFAVLPAITGVHNLCIGDTLTAHDAHPGGAWSSSNIAVATIGSSTGLLTGISAGTVNITYNTGTDSVWTTVTVNPTPMLSSSLTPPYLCDSSLFNYVPTSAVPGTIFNWARAFIIGISNPAGTGIGNPFESLYNTTNFPLAVAYTFTLTANGCTNTQIVTVTVNPTPRLSSTLTPPGICDSQLFSYTPASATPGATFAWDRPPVTGILPSTATGTGSVSEYLIDTTNHPITVTYFYRLGINGCTNLYLQSVTVVVDTCFPTLIGNITNSGGSLQITPNPCTIQTVVSGLDHITRIEVYNSLGKQVFSQWENLSSSLIVDMAGQPRGIYYIIASDNERRLTAKIVKQ